MSLPGDASLVCIPPADELTVGDHHQAVKMNSLVLDGGVLGSKAAGRGLSVCAVNSSAGGMQTSDASSGSDIDPSLTELSCRAGLQLCMYV